MFPSSFTIGCTPQVRVCYPAFTPSSVPSPFSVKSLRRASRRLHFRDGWVHKCDNHKEPILKSRAPPPSNMTGYTVYWRRKPLAGPRRATSHDASEVDESKAHTHSCPVVSGSPGRSWPALESKRPHRALHGLALAENLPDADHQRTRQTSWGL
jgi:hypothetical protein